MTRLMFGAGTIADLDAGHTAPGRAVFAILLDIIEAGIRAGVFRPREPRELALVAWSSLHGLAMLLTAGELDVDVDVPGVLERLVGAVISNVIYGIVR